MINQQIFKNITLVGMPGSGKSTVGVLLAKALGFDFMDTDLIIQKQQGKMLQTLVNDLGVEGFLDVENATISSIQCQGFVISPGGSAVCRHEMASHLKTLGPVVFLHVPLEELERRMNNLPTRGIAMKQGETLADVMKLRLPLYEKYADFKVTVTEDMTASHIAQTILQQATLL